MNQIIEDNIWDFYENSTIEPEVKLDSERLKKFRKIMVHMKKLFANHLSDLRICTV